VLRIHDILAWIRIRIWIRGSKPLTGGSGSCYFRHRSSTCQNYLKKVFLMITFTFTFLSFFKDKKSKRSHKAGNQGFSYYFCLVTEGSGSGSVPLTNGSGSRRLKNIRIRRIRICNTGERYRRKTEWHRGKSEKGR
jgi:hypothetical protein